jgi:hypothetical protein
MPSTFPSALDVLVNPGPADFFDTPGVELDVQLDNLNDAVENIEAKLGTDSSIVTTSIDYKMSHHQHSGSDGSASYSALTLQSASTIVSALTVKRVASQTAPLQQWQDESASVLAQVNKDGKGIFPSFQVSGVSALAVTTAAAGSAVQVPLTVQGFSGQSADLMKFQNSSLVDLTRVSASGMVRAPAFGSGVDATDPFQAILSTGPQFTAQATAARPKMGVRAFNTGSTDTLRLYTDVAGGTYPLELSAASVAATKPLSVQGTTQPMVKVGDGSLDTLSVDTTTDSVKILNSGLLQFFSDNGTTSKGSVNAANGNAIFAGTVFGNVFMPTAPTWTSTSHPASPTTGTEVYETDTGLWVYWDGTAWVVKPGQFIASGVVGANTPAASGTIRQITTFSFTMPNLGTLGGTKRFVRVELNIPSLVHGTAPTLHDLAIVYLRNAAGTVNYRTFNTTVHGVVAGAATINHPGMHIVQHFNHSQFVAGSTATIAISWFCASGTVGLDSGAFWIVSVV